MRTDAAEFDRLERLFDKVADVQVCILVLGIGDRDLIAFILDVRMIDDLPTPPGFVVARFAVDLDAHVCIFLEALFGSTRQRRLDSAEHDLFLHVLLARQRVNQQQHFAIHYFLLQSIFGTSRARST